MAVDDSYTKSLLHCDGTDGSTTITDESGKAWTAAGNAQIDTAIKNFGTGSLLIPNNTSLISTADHADWYVDADHTLDLWFYTLDVTKYAMLYAILQDGTHELSYFYQAAAKYLVFYHYYGAYQLRFRVAFSPTVNTWYHIALERYGNVWNIFVNGVAQAKTLENGAYAMTYSNWTTGPQVGVNSAAYGYHHIDEWRWSITARYQGNDFTPPTAPYAPPGGIIPATMHHLKLLRQKM